MNLLFVVLGYAALLGLSMGFVFQFRNVGSDKYARLAIVAGALITVMPFFWAAFLVAGVWMEGTEEGRATVVNLFKVIGGYTVPFIALWIVGSFFAWRMGGRAADAKSN